MTPEERGKLNKRLAVAMGWKPNTTIEETTSSYGWLSPDGVWRYVLRDYDTDPVAADELLRWLAKHGYAVVQWNVNETLFGATVHFEGRGPEERHFESDVPCEALARATDAALILAADAALKGKG